MSSTDSDVSLTEETDADWAARLALPFFLITLLVSFVGMALFGASQAGVLPMTIPYEVPWLAQFAPSGAAVYLAGLRALSNSNVLHDVDGWGGHPALLVRVAHCTAGLGDPIHPGSRLLPRDSGSDGGTIHCFHDTTFCPIRVGGQSERGERPHGRIFPRFLEYNRAHNDGVVSDGVPIRNVADDLGRGNRSRRHQPVALLLPGSRWMNARSECAEVQFPTTFFLINNCLLS